MESGAAAKLGSPRERLPINPELTGLWRTGAAQGRGLGLPHPRSLGPQGWTRIMISGVFQC